MVLEFQNLHDRRQGQTEDNERRVTDSIASEEQEALRGQRNHMQQKQQTLFQVEET